MCKLDEFSEEEPGENENARLVTRGGRETLRNTES